MSEPTSNSGRDIAQRRSVMAVCAAAMEAELDTVLASLTSIPPVRDLRRAETGLVMLRGRMGADGAAFNLGEATVTRAAVALEGPGAVGQAGFAYHLGRDAARARKAATIDALWQVPDGRHAVEAALEPVTRRVAADGAQAARQAAATRVNFFTLARGED